MQKEIVDIPSRKSNHQRWVIITCILSGLVLLFLCISLVHYFVPSFDKNARLWLIRVLPYFNRDFLWMVSSFGKEIFVLPATMAIVAWWLIRRKWDQAIGLSFCVILGAGLIFGTKVLFSIQNNVHLLQDISSLDLGYPSGHAALATLFYGYFAFIACGKEKNRFWISLTKIIGVLIPFIIGMTRLILMVHYTTDVLGGWVIGAFWLYITDIVLSRVPLGKQK
ncbi:MAG: phosphatase PAP2 family protein [Anaerolineaceae bacterium]